MTKNFSDKKEFHTKKLNQQQHNRYDGGAASNVPGKKLLKCFKCQEKGHFKKFCPNVNTVT